MVCNLVGGCMTKHFIEFCFVIHRRKALNLGQLGPIAIYRCHITSIRIPITKIRRSYDRRIIIIEIPIPGKTMYIFRRGPGLWSTNIVHCLLFAQKREVRYDLHKLPQQYMSMEYSRYIQIKFKLLYCYPHNSSTLKYTDKDTNSNRERNPSELLVP